MEPCNHRQKLCEKCGNCPRCPSCLCRGPRRGRGRPRKAAVPTIGGRKRRASYSNALQAIARNQVKNDDRSFDMNPPQYIASRAISSILQDIGLQTSELRLLPSSERRNLRYTDFLISERDSIHIFTEKVKRAFITRLLPNSVDDIMDAFQKNRMEKTEQAIVEGMRASRPGIIERRTMRALVCSTNSSAVAHHLILSTRCEAENEYGQASEEEEESDVDVVGEGGGVRINTTDTGTGLGHLHPAPGIREVDSRMAILPQQRVDADFRCGVVGCIIDVNISPGQEGTATGHNFSTCGRAVHLLCCSRVLGLETMNEDCNFLCTSCHEKANREAVLDTGNFIDGRPEISAEEGFIPSESEPGNRFAQGGSSQRALLPMKRNAPEPQHLDNRNRKWRTGAFVRTYQRSRKDWKFIICNGFIPTTVRTRAIRSDDDISMALKFLFRSENVQLLSWGTKRIRTSDDKSWIQFPAVIRRGTTEQIHSRYVQYCKGNDRRPLSRSAFYGISSELTGGQQKRKTAVDYVLGCLFYDNMRTVRDIVNAEVPSQDLKRKLLAQVDAVEEFMKFTFLEHVGSDQDALHDQAYSFSLQSSDQVKESSCKACMTHFQVIRNVQCAITSCPDDIETALYDCQEKLLLFMAHQHRCKNQQNRISKAFQAVPEDDKKEKVLILIDYKMKLEPVRYREKTTEFFGKRGMSWHGAVIFHSEGKKELSTIFIDHILDNDTKQDRIAVASLVDAVLARLKVELPTVRTFTLLSDNARCYQNDLLPVMLPFIAKHHGISISNFIHSETQQDKSLVDAHFALAMMHINRFINSTRSDVCTPSAVIDAINWEGSIANTVAEMLRINRRHPNLMFWEEAVHQKKFEKLGRINEFLFKAEKEGKYEVDAFKISGRDKTVFVFKHVIIPARLHLQEIGDGDEEEESLRAQEDETGEIEAFAVPREATYVSSVTGVTVWGGGRLRRLRKRRARRVVSNDAIDDTVESQIQQGRYISNPSAGVGEVEGNVAAAVFLECSKCRASYRRQDFLNTHESKCTGAPVKNTITSRAVSIAFQMLSAAEIGLYTTKQVNPALLDIVIGTDVLHYCRRKKGWAARPAYGQSLGTNTVYKYKDELTGMFMLGQKEKALKMSASHMRESLRSKFSRAYDTPGEQFITRFVSSQLYAYRKRQGASASVAQSIETPVVGQGSSIVERSSIVRRGVPPVYLVVIGSLLEEDPEIKPRQIQKLLMEKMELEEGTLPEDFPEDQALKNKLSALKSASRRVA